MDHFGAQIPADTSKVVEEEEDDMPELSEDEPTPTPTPTPAKEEVEEPEEKIEDNGLLPPDNDPPLEQGDSSIEVTEEMMDAANSLKSEAMQAQREGDLQKAVELFTKAIKSNPRSGILYGSRASALLELKKPVAAIRDCDIAITKNPDSAKSYKVRARAHRALGNYEQAMKDVQLGQKLDWDESSHKFEHDVKEFADKAIANRKKREAKQHNKQQHSQAPPPFSGSAFPGGNPFGGGNPLGGMPPEFMEKIMSDPEVLTLLQDPKILEAINDPSKMAQLQNDPRVAKLFAKFAPK